MCPASVRSTSRITVTWTLALVAALALGLLWSSQAGNSRVLAQGAPFDCASIVSNGSFEDPDFPDGAVGTEVPTGWAIGGRFDVHNFDAHSGRQTVHLGVEVSLSQALDTSTLRAGDTITIAFAGPYFLASMIVTLGSASTSVDGVGDWSTGSISHTLVDDAEPVSLTFRGDSAPAMIDSVTATCTGPAPTATNTATATMTATATATMTATATATNAPTVTPSPTATATTIPDGITDSTLQITGDPRFPITGSAAIPGEPGLTYILHDTPAIGNVLVQPDGTFTYTAPATMADGDVFTVLATAPGGETALVTVVVTFEVDKTIPTYGKVNPGGSNGGGDITDARSPGDSVNDDDAPDPTSTPSGGRVQR